MREIEMRRREEMEWGREKKSKRREREKKERSRRARGGGGESKGLRKDRETIDLEKTMDGKREGGGVESKSEWVQVRNWAWKSEIIEMERKREYRIDIETTQVTNPNDYSPCQVLSVPVAPLWADHLSPGILPVGAENLSVLPWWMGRISLSKF